jgi:hypothetical protein
MALMLFAFAAFFLPLAIYAGITGIRKKNKADRSYHDQEKQPD